MYAARKLKIPVIAHGDKGKVRFIDRGIIAAWGVVIPHKRNFVMGQAVFFAIKIQSVVFVVGRWCHVKGRGAANKHAVFRKQGNYFVIHHAALLPVRVEGQLIRLHSFGAQNGKGDTAGRMVLHTVAVKSRVAIFLPQVCNALFHSCYIAGKAQIPFHFQGAGFFAEFSILQAIIADDVDGVPCHLPEDPSALPGTGHKQLVLFPQLIEHIDILRW